RRFGDTGFTFPARAQVDARVVVAGGVDVFPFAFLLVLGEDPVAAVHRRVVGGQVLADPSVRALLFGALAAVPVEGVALRPVGARTVVVARSHVFDRDVVGLQDLDPVAAAGGGFAFAVEDHGVAVHPADVDSAVGARDEDFFVVGAGLDQDPVAVVAARRVDRRLDRRVVRRVRRDRTFRRAGLADDVDVRRFRGKRGSGHRAERDDREHGADHVSRATGAERATR